MRPPYARYSVRRMMAAVAIAGLVLGLMAWMRARAEDFRWRAELNLMNAGACHHPEDSPAVMRRLQYYASLVEKYEWSASHPWLPVAPDPPEPE
jgi:hypothetical protein